MTTAERARTRLDLEGDVALLTLADPPLNLFRRDLVRELSGRLDEIAAMAARALVIRAEGRVFTGGVDVGEFDGLTPDEARVFVAESFELAHKLEDLPLPTIACVHGLCLTAGFELSLACDLIWAAESAQFGLVEIVVGVSPFMGGTQRVAERAGPARARELVMTGQTYPAATLERWNVVNRVLPDAEFGDQALAFAARLASGPTRANAATKQVVRAFLDDGVRGADERTGDIVAPLFDTEDLKGAVKTFLAEGPGKATYRGR